MKRLTYIIILVLALGVAAALLIIRSSNSSISRELRDFAVEDTASVDRIFMVRKDNQQVMLKREGNQWVVNDRFVARPDAVDNLLKTLKRIRVKSPVSNSALENTIRMLATRNTKVEVYSGRKLLKTIYVGGPTQDQMGTFMLLEGSSVPFVVHIPGFIGYLSTRFFVEESAWKSTSLFNYNFNDIKEVTVVNAGVPSESFRVANLGDNRYEVTSPDGVPFQGRLDTLGVKYYLSRFEKLNFEFYADSIVPTLRDSLLQAVPYRSLKLKDSNGTRRTLVAWKRPANGKLDAEGNPQIWDDERLYALLDDKTWIVIQFYVFSGIFTSPANFFLQGN